MYDTRRANRNEQFLKWGLIALVALVLGGFALVFDKFEPQWGALTLVLVAGAAALPMLGELRRWLLAVAILDTPLELDKYLGYDDLLGDAGSVAGLGISLTTICLIALYVLWLINYVFNHDESYQNWEAPARPLTLYLCFVLLSVLVAQEVSFAGFELFMLVQMFLLHVYIIGNVQRKDELEFLIVIMMAALTLESLLALLAPFIAGEEGYEIAGLELVAWGTRTAGTLGSPNTAASYFVPMMMVAVGGFLVDFGRFTKLTTLIAFSLGLIALILTESRGGWLAFAIAFSLFMFIALYKQWISLKVPLMLLGVMSIPLALLSQTILLRLTADDNNSALSRIPLMQLAFTMIQDNIWLGVGANNFASRIDDYLRGDTALEWIFTVHNKYLLVWAENGLFALLAFSAFLLITIWRGLSAITFAKHPLAPLSVAIGCGVIATGIHMHFDIFNSRPQVQTLWVLAAVAVVVQRMIQNTRTVNLREVVR